MSKNGKKSASFLAKSSQGYVGKLPVGESGGKGVGAFVGKGGCLHKDLSQLWPSREKYMTSKKLHDDSYAAMLARDARAASALLSKLDSGVDELDLSPDERRILLVGKRKSTTTEAGMSGGPKRPSEILKAMLGFAVPMLGKYAMNIAMEWLNSEIKYIQSTVGPAGLINSTTGYNLLNGIAQGTDYNQRIGNSIRILGLDGFLEVHNQHADAAQAYRYWLFVDTQSDGAAPTDATFFEGGAGAVQQQVPNILKAPDRYAILHDKHFVFDASVNAIHIDRIRLDDLVKQDVHTLYELTTGVIAAISRGALYFAHISTDSVNSLTVTAYFRVFYTDN